MLQTILPTLNRKYSKYIIIVNLSRTRLKVCTDVITGHFKLNKHVTRIEKRDVWGTHRLNRALSMPVPYIFNVKI